MSIEDLSSFKQASGDLRKMAKAAKKKAARSSTAKHPAKTEPDFSRVVEIDWNFPENTQSRYATRIVVQHDEHEFYINFFDVQNPILLGTPEEMQKMLEGITSIRADCVARVIVSASRMREMISALQKNLDRYEAKRKQEGDE